MRSMIWVATCVMLATACKGAEGPAGPQGPQGPPGPPGPTNFYSTAGSLPSSGDIAIPLPGVPSGARPLLACYITDRLSQPVAWLQISDGDPGDGSLNIGCGLVLSGNQWTAVLVNAPSFWFYYVAVTW